MRRYWLVLVGCTWRKSVGRVFLVLAIGAVLVASHVYAYRAGQHSIERDASWRITACQGLDAEAVLNVSLRAADAAQKTPAAFQDADRRYLVAYLKGAADEVERKLLPFLPRIYPEPDERKTQAARAEEMVRRARESAEALTR